MHFNAVTAARRPSLRNHLTYAKHADQTGNQRTRTRGEICFPDLREIRGTGGRIDSAI